MTEILFRGPFSLHRDAYNCKCLFDDDEAAKHPGVYLWTIPVEREYKPYYIGMTSKTIIRRTRDHLRNYATGQYWVYDYKIMAQSLVDARIHEHSDDVENFLFSPVNKHKYVIDQLMHTRLFIYPEASDDNDSKSVSDRLKRLESWLINAYTNKYGEEDYKNRLENGNVSISIDKIDQYEIKVSYEYPDPKVKPNRTLLLPVS